MQMKLIFCWDCNDIVKLKSVLRYCECGESSGKYVDELKAEIFGPCLPLGIANSSFAEAVHNQPKIGMGKEFTAFVIQKECDTVKHHNPS
jgi:hypothetical protein